MVKGLSIACLLGGFIFALEIPASFGLRSEGAKPEAVKAFRHKDHVRQAWGRAGEPEYDRDCKGCHQFGKKGESGNPREPQSTCNTCHEAGAVDINIPETKPEFRQNLNSLRDPGRVFDHQDHASERCDSCHSPVSGKPGSIGETGEMIMARGWQTCMVCHDPAATQSPSKDDRSLVSRFLSSINSKLAARPPNPSARFDHRTHLPSHRPVKESDCMTCHEGIASSDPKAWGPGSINSKACANCHIADAAGTPLVMEFALRPHTSRTAGTFSHAQHLGPQAAARDAAIAQKACLACHVPVEGGLTYELSPAFTKDAFTACSSCHAHQGPEWQVKDASGVVDHGEVGSCGACHSFGEGDMKTMRPLVTVDRPVVSQYVFLSQQHPLITKGKHGEGVAESCKECHRAIAQEGLPSRIAGRPFNHDTHLPAKPTDADCVRCHTSVTTSESSSTLSVIETAGCKDCHRGETVTLLPAEGDGKRTVGAFPHALHLTQSAQQKGVVGCVSCHTAAQDGVATVGVLPKAADCTACHDHGTAPAITGGKDRTYVSSCRNCHGDAGIADGGSFLDQRSVMGVLRPGQYHPDPQNRACADCHLTRDLSFETRSAANVWANVLYQQRTFHGLARPKGTNEDCFGCHWVEIIENRPPQ